MEFRVLVITSLVGLSLLFQSCSKEVIIDVIGHQEKLVVDGFIEPGFPPVVILSKSKNVFGDNDVNALLSSFISGASVSVTSDGMTIELDEICTNNLPAGLEPIFASFFGVDVEQLEQLNLCLYTSANPQSFGQVGKTYSLNILYDGEVYSGTTSIIQPQALDSVFWKEDPNVPNHGFSWARLTDNAATYDCYFWECRRINLDENGEPRDPFFRTVFNPAVDDQFFNGLSFEFAYENPFSFNNETPFAEQGFFKRGDTVEIKFSKIDADAFRFLERKHYQIQSGGPNPFAAPLNVQGNISNGALGAFIGYSPTIHTLICE
jgi:hypothetical protein